MPATPARPSGVVMLRSQLLTGRRRWVLTRLSPAPAGCPRPVTGPAAAPWLVLTRFSSRSANLSDSYFTNRQDRYVFLQDCPDVADFFTELVDAVGDVSLQLQGDDTVQVVEGMVHPYKGGRGRAAPEPGPRRAASVALPGSLGGRAWFCFCHWSQTGTHWRSAMPCWRGRGWDRGVGLGAQAWPGR